MAKAQKKQNRFLNQGIPTTASVQEKTSIPSFFQQVTGVIIDKEKDDLLERDEILREELYEAIEKLNNKQKKLESLKKDCDEKKQLLEQEDENLISRENLISEHENLIKIQQEDLERKKNELLVEQKYITQKKIDMQHQQIVIKEDLASLDVQRHNAELGFAQEKLLALDEKRQALDDLHQQALNKLSIDSSSLAQKEQKIFDQKQKLILAEAEAKEGFIQIKSELMQDWASEKSKQEMHLATIKKKIEQKELELEQAQQTLQTDQYQFDAQIEAMRNSIRHEFSVNITKLKSSNENLEQSHNRALDEIDNLTAKLQQYSDLERQLSGQGVLSLQDELENLRKKNRDLREKLSERSEEGLEEENERLESLCDDLEQKVFDLRQKSNDLENEVNNARLSVMEKQHLQQEKRVLEQHKRILDTSIMQLQTQIDGLIEKQQGELPFKSLSEMDQVYRSEARGLQIVPDLKQFSLIMQSNIAKQNYYYSLKDIRLFIAGLAMSKLHLLQGISGTGKTTLARAFAKSINNASNEAQEKQYCEIVRVQAGWRDREDLLGHFNAFEKRFYTKEALQALYRAQQPKFKDTLQIILLDEMNLSQPEQYFADFLSLMETPDRAEINLLDSANGKAPELFVDQRAIRIPPNVWFIGTANHDETTKEFADKTYDRAHVMEVKRSKEDIDISYAQAEQYSYSSLIQNFKQAEKQFSHVVIEIFDRLKDSLLEDAVSAVQVSWGNRLERQASSFIPVYMAMGGSASEALDHLFATKLFRKGKLTGRYDTRADKIELIANCLEEIWLDLGFNDMKPEVSLTLLNDDIERLKGNL